MSDTKKDQIFVSYAHENLETVKNVVLGLKKRKLNVWFDKKNMEPGKWKKQIMREIKSHSQMGDTFNRTIVAIQFGLASAFI